MGKICVIGHFGLGQNLLNGQTIKSNNLVNVISEHTDIDILKIDTHGWIKRPLSLIRSIKKAFSTCDSIIMLPAHNGVKVFSPILVHYKAKYQKNIFYDVIGGWLPTFIQSKPNLKKCLRKFDGIWVETSTMARELLKQGFENVTIIPNFKDISPLDENKMIYPLERPLKLCTFSRVMKEKGIEDAVEAVKAANSDLGCTAFSLDIYGQIDSRQTDWFADYEKTFPSYISYKGAADSNKSVEVLNGYYALLFPTRFYTEGIPGTIIDAYSAGIPVISSKWESFADVIDEGITGIGYEFGSRSALESVLLHLEHHSSELTEYKRACIRRAKDFTPESVLATIFKALEK